MTDSQVNNRANGVIPFNPRFRYAKRPRVVWRNEQLTLGTSNTPLVAIDCKVPITELHPFGLIAYNYDEANHNLSLGFSLCCKTDRFNKNEARRLAVEKLSTQPIQIDTSKLNADTIPTILQQLPYSLHSHTIFLLNKFILS